MDLKEQLYIQPITFSDNVIQLNMIGYFNLIWLNEGNVDVIIDQKKRTLSHGEICMVLPDSSVELQGSDKSTVLLIAFSIEFISFEAKEYALDIFRLFVGYYKNPKVKMSDYSFERIATLSKFMLEEIQLDIPSTVIVRSYLKILLMTLIRDNHVEITLPDKNVERIHDFFSLIHHFATTQKRVSFYAGKLFISPKRLNQILQGLTNKSASYFIHEHLIMEAKKQLLTGERTINEIADILGFEDRAYFSRFFKKWTGISPENYKMAYFNKPSAVVYKEGIINLGQ